MWILFFIVVFFIILLAVSAKKSKSNLSEGTQGFLLVLEIIAVIILIIATCWK